MLLTQSPSGPPILESLLSPASATTDGIRPDICQRIHLTVCPISYMVNYQMLQGFAKIILQTRDNRSRTGVLYIPADVVKDSSFPFDPDQEVVVRIDGKRLVVEERGA